MKTLYDVRAVFDRSIPTACNKREKLWTQVEFKDGTKVLHGQQLSYGKAVRAALEIVNRDNEQYTATTSQQTQETQ